VRRLPGRSDWHSHWTPLQLRRWPNVV